MIKILFRNSEYSEKELLLRCNIALRKLIKFILNQQNEDGLWYDFQTHRSGQSNSWVSGNVLWQLGRILPKKVKMVAFQQLSEQLNGNKHGWGFSSFVPVDCDSTLHVINAFLLSNEKNLYLENIIQFILSHQRDSGGFSTFSSPNPLVKYRGGLREEYSGWIQEHGCVSAVALQTLNRMSIKNVQEAKRRLLSFIAKNQKSEGYWESYWWRSKFFATGRIVGELINQPSLITNDVAKYGLHYILQKFHEDGYWDNGYKIGIPCTISTVCCARALLIVKEEKKLIRIVDWILNHQNPEGFWQSPPILQIPNPQVIAPNADFSWQTSRIGVNSCTSDKNNIYTSSLVGGFLLAFSDYIKGKPNG